VNLTTVSDFQLQNKDIFGYEHQQNSLVGAALKTANIVADVKATQNLYGHRFQPS